MPEINYKGGFGHDDCRAGFGTGDEWFADRSRLSRDAQGFVRALGERIRNGGLCVQGVPTSEETASLARQEVPILAEELTRLAKNGGNHDH